MHLIGFAESNYLPSAFDNEVLSDGFCQRPRGSESHGCRHSAPRPEGTGAPRHPQPRSRCQDPHSPWGRWGGGCPWLLGSAPALRHCRTRCCSGGCRNQPGACGQTGAGGCTPPPAVSPLPQRPHVPAPRPPAQPRVLALLALQKPRGLGYRPQQLQRCHWSQRVPPAPPPGHPGSCSQAPWQKVCAARAATPAPHPSPSPSDPAPIP